MPPLQVGLQYHLKNMYWEFPVGLVVRTWCFHCCSLGSIPGLRTEDPYQAKVKKRKTKPTKNPTTIKEDKKIITKDIDKILKMCLGDKATKDTCTTFEKELAFICSDDYKYKSKEQLEKIKNDFLNDWQLKMKTSKEEYVKAKKYSFLLY